MSIDFSQINGEEFEFFCRDLFESLGVEILSDPSRGPDGKKDLIIRQSVEDIIGRKESYTLLVQCKNKAVSQKSIYESDLGDIRSACGHHGTDGYFLITTTVLSTTVQRNFEAIKKKGTYIVHYWDKYKLEEYILKSIDGIDLLEKYEIKHSKYKTYHYNVIVPKEFEFLNKINGKIGQKIKPVSDLDDFPGESNSCYIENGHILWLNLKKCDLGELIEELDVLAKLTVLSLSEMQINSFPKSITKLKNLGILSIDKNNIKILPKDIMNLNKLHQLDISHNPLEKIEIDEDYLRKLDDITINESQFNSFKNLFEKLDYLDIIERRDLEFQNLLEKVSLSIEKDRLKKYGFLEQLEIPKEDKEKIYIYFEENIIAPELNSFEFMKTIKEMVNQALARNQKNPKKLS